MCDYQDYIDPNSEHYARIMDRRMNWDPFGKEVGRDNHDSFSTLGDEVFMEMVQENIQTSDIKKKPYYYKYYDCMGMSDELIEENHNRYMDNSKKYITIREKHTDSSGMEYNVYITRSAVTQKYQAGKNPKYEVPNASTKKNEKNSTDDKNKSEEESNSKYVPPSIRKKQDGLFDDTPKNRNLFVSNIPREYMEDDIANIIDGCGKIYDIRIHRNKYTGESKGSAIVKCETHETACKIIEKFNRCVMGNLMAHIAFADERNNKKGGRGNKRR